MENIAGCSSNRVREVYADLYGVYLGTIFNPNVSNTSKIRSILTLRESLSIEKKLVVKITKNENNIGLINLFIKKILVIH